MKVSFYVTLRSFDFRLTFLKQRSQYDGRHVTRVAFEGTGKDKTAFHAYARLGKGDVGRYDFFAGSRIALDKLFNLLEGNGWPYEDILAIRRQAQLHVSIEQNNARTNALYAQQNQLAVESKALRSVLASILAEEAERASRARSAAREVARVVTAQMRAAAKQPEPVLDTDQTPRLVKPATYRSVNDGQALPNADDIFGTTIINNFAAAEDRAYMKAAEDSTTDELLSAITIFERASAEFAGSLRSIIAKKAGK